MAMQQMRPWPSIIAADTPQDHDVASIQEHMLLVEIEHQISHDIKQLEHVDDVSLTTLDELERQIQNKLSKMRALRRDLELQAEEAETEEERELIAKIISAHVSRYHEVQQEIRSSTVKRRQKLGQKAMAQRQELLGGPEAVARRRQLITEGDVVAKSQGITESLRRTRQLMSEELDHTSTTLATMDASHAQLGKTRNQYLDQHGLLYRSKGLLRTLYWQNKSERFLLWCGLALFALTAAYVVHKRAIYFVPEPLRPMTIVRSGIRFIGGSAGQYWPLMKQNQSREKRRDENILFEFHGDDRRLSSNVEANVENGMEQIEDNVEAGRDTDRPSTHEDGIEADTLHHMKSRNHQGVSGRRRRTHREGNDGALTEQDIRTSGAEHSHDSTEL